MVILRSDQLQIHQTREIGLVLLLLQFPRKIFHEIWYCGHWKWTYYKNYIFNDISAGFNATENEFTLKQNGSDVPGISTEGAVILVNDIFQSPGLTDQYVLSEQSIITSITFQGTNTVPLGPDVGISSYPKGGIIVSVASTEGFGYQPLVAAAGGICCCICFWNHHLDCYW